MAGLRIRWRGVARVAAILVVGLLVLRLLPGFLRAPEPPPLAADVGLPQVKPVTEPPRGGAAQPMTDVSGRRAVGRARAAVRPRKQRRRSRSQKSRPRPVRDAPASRAVIGSKRKHRVRTVAKPPSRPGPKPESTPPPVPEYIPPVAPEPLPEPSPATSSTPGDGSQEFAPH
jgi:hypothetical protein